MREVIGWICLISAILLVIFSMVGLITGCHYAQPKPEPIPVTPPDPIVKVIHSTDWFMSLMMIATVVSLFAGLNGLKMGWAGVLACGGGLALKAALSSVYVFWICGLLFVVCLVLATFSILIKNKALREIVTGVQVIRNSVPPEQKETMSTILSSEQTDYTKKLVTKVKTVLKRKGLV